MQDTGQSRSNEVNRRTVVAGVAVMATGTAAEAQQAAPAHVKGPLVWLDMDQRELDDAYDQAVYAPNSEQIAKRLLHHFAANFSDGRGEWNVFGTNLYAVLRVAAFLNSADAHQCAPRNMPRRATKRTTPTVATIRATSTSAPAHACRCHSSKGEMAYTKICSGRAAMGWFTFMLQN